jgi:GT2 family glycosyltransferase
MAGERSVRIVLPVYGAAAELEACLASLEHTVGNSVAVHLADDASPHQAVADVIGAALARAALDLRHVRRERNLGFVGNVNLALRETGRDDVILLNSDTVTSRGWLERLRRCAASDARIATITPWSNNAEICSYPQFCRSGPMPDEPDRYGDAAARLEPEYPDLPTGVGFCMFLRRAALEAIGDFDQATFGRGYGEENDFCLRAEAHGWRNVLCDDAYVAHRGGASFGAEGHRPGGENLARLNARYPGYNARIAEFILHDPLRPLRDRLDQQLRAVPTQHDLFARPA